jgi:hypothetical protein
MTSTAKISFPYKADLVSRDFNHRFADFFGGSIMKGFRFGVSDKSGYVSLIKGTDEKNLLVTHGGIMIEDEDKMNEIYIHPNDHATNDRIDSIYAVHIHGNDVVSYIVVSGNAETGEAAPVKPEETHTLLGYVFAPSTNRMLLEEHLKPLNNGLKELKVEGNATIHGDVYVGGIVDIAGEVKLSGSVHRSSYATVNKAGFMTATDKTLLKTLSDKVDQLIQASTVPEGPTK